MTGTDHQIRARIARQRAHRLGLQFQQSGPVGIVLDKTGTMLTSGLLGEVNAWLVERSRPRPAGPAPSVTAPADWEEQINDYLLSLRAAGQRPATIALRNTQLCRIARDLHCQPGEVTAEGLLKWFGKRSDLSQEGRHSYRSAVRGFFEWAYLFGRIPTNPAELLPRVRVPQAPPRPASDEAWVAALAASTPRVRLMLRLAGEAGLRRAEVAVVNTGDLIDVAGQPGLIVDGKGGKKRILPISDSLADEIRLGAAGHTSNMPATGWLFPDGVGSHITANHVGRLVKNVLPPGFTMHTLRHRFATRAYRGTRNLRAVQELLGHSSVATTQRYTALSADELRATMLAASAPHDGV